MKQEEHILWDTVELLCEQQQYEKAGVILKSIVQRIFTLFRLPADILDGVSFEVSSTTVLVGLHKQERIIRQQVMAQDIERAATTLQAYLGILEQLISSTQRSGWIQQIMSRLVVAHYYQASAVSGNWANSEKVHEQRVSYASSVYTSKEAATLIGVSDQTIRRWCEAGKYPDAYQTEGGHWRIPHSYFKLNPAQAQHRKDFALKLDVYNARQGVTDESEFL
ncbi:MerR family transcriptional regulator [Paenibacillus sp. WLX2291]|uniref:MerR family transcriptional regulator n=1 Tax=Paenibacillus sp. WLX2291 TaxID=3296934 RepID=UPI00398440F7